ncbi:MAG TPA: alpha amylase C-terminal domain-containing protein, partial [Terriglobales bacterium]|nr:alpha amylase C-terminal domain-containing protein [Terriglobales bacterium]
VMSFARRDGDRHILVVLNLTPVPRHDYRIGVPSPATYRCCFNSDAGCYGGSNYEVAQQFESSPWPQHGYDHSLALTLPPLGALILIPNF